MPDLITILAEDRTSQEVLRHYAKRVEPQSRIYLIPVPAGRQAGEQYVREHYPEKATNQRSPLRRSALIVHIDADVGNVAQRQAQLDAALEAKGKEARGPNERISIVVPRRHTETWLHGLAGDPVDEVYDYKDDPEHRSSTGKRQRDELAESRIIPAAQALYDLTRNNAPAPPAELPSLQAAIPELRRLEL